jgi:nucleoside-diphosphate-sugar epimerase
MPIEETEGPNFFDLFYSRTKIYTEAALSSIKSSGNILQLRILLPLDFKPHPRNLLDKLIGFKNVIDIPNSITYIPDFLDAMKYLIKNDAEGIYNVVNYGGLRFRTLLEEYRKYVPTHNYAITEPRELKLIRNNLILSTDKLEESGFPVRDINDVIPECVEKYINLLRTNAGQNKQTQEQEPRIIPDGTAKV